MKLRWFYVIALVALFPIKALAFGNEASRGQYRCEPGIIDPLTKAVNQDDLTTIQNLIAQYPDIKPEQFRVYSNAGLYSMLMFSAGHNYGNTCHPEIVKLLVLQGADLNTENPDGLLPLHVATIQGNYPIVKFLVEHGADIESKDGFGMTAIQHAIAWNRQDILQFLIFTLYIRWLYFFVGALIISSIIIISSKRLRQFVLRRKLMIVCVLLVIIAGSAAYLLFVYSSHSPMYRNHYEKIISYAVFLGNKDTVDSALCSGVNPNAIYDGPFCGWQSTETLLAWANRNGRSSVTSVLISHGATERTTSSWRP